jgi:phage gp29-like protein
MAKQYAVIAPGWEIQPARYEKDQEKQAAQEIADFIIQNLNDMDGSFNSKLIEMLSALIYGYSVAEKVFWLIDYGRFAGKVGLKDLSSAILKDSTSTQTPSVTPIQRGCCKHSAPFLPRSF